MNNIFYSYETLLDRLVNCTQKGNKQIVFLLGAPVSAPYIDEQKGVDDVFKIVENIKHQFSSDPKTCALLEQELSSASGNSYQVAFNFLLGRRGQDAVNETIRYAVLGARAKFKAERDDLIKSIDQDIFAKGIEDDLAGWHIPVCLSELARLCSRYPKVYGGVQLTTNFDPLLSLALRSCNQKCCRSVLSRDGNIEQIQTDVCHVVHLHGYWHGSDTLHTPRQLNQVRPNLKASLSKILHNSVVVPVAYSGWDDVFTRTLLEVVNEDSQKHEILWTYFGNNDADLIAQNQKQIQQFQAGIDSGRMILYKGVNCHQLFSDLANELLDKPCIVSKDVAIKSETSPAVDVLDKLVIQSNKDGIESDPIPKVLDLLGREDEITILENSSNRIVCISGMGGQGKSSIAAYYANKRKDQSDIEFVDWRDCREQSNTFHSTLVKLYRRFGCCDISESVLSSFSTTDIASRVALELRKRNVLVVFDNVDQYVDVELESPLGALKVLIDECQKQSIISQIIITSRPRISLETSDFAFISLRGLLFDPAKKLFDMKSQKQVSNEIFRPIFELTEGHPLWISLIGSRCRNSTIGVERLLENIRSGKGDLPDRTIYSIWNSLNDKQKTVLRTLSELERPLPEKDLEQIDFDLNFNQLTKAIKALKQLSLIEDRLNFDGTQLVDLHPLIRQFIRKNYPQSERLCFISKIMIVLDKKLAKLRMIFVSSVPMSVIEVWTHRVDVLINSGDSLSSIESLVEIYHPLIQVGMSEEYVRLSLRAFALADWSTVFIVIPSFNRMWSNAINTMIQLGNIVQADQYLEKYKVSIEGKGGQYINYCNSLCYKFWFTGDYANAISIGEEGERIIKSTQIDTSFSTTHNLALALRDSGRTEDALAYFLGQSIEADILNPINIEPHKNGSFYGNIGRCYHLDNKIEHAIICYKKSAKLLENEKEELINRGYVRKWAGTLVLQLGRFEDSAIFYRAAIALWKGCLPTEALLIEKELNALFEEHPHLMRVMDIPTWKIENRFLEWVNT